MKFIILYVVFVLSLFGKGHADILCYECDDCVDDIDDSKLKACPLSMSTTTAKTTDESSEPTEISGPTTTPSDEETTTTKEEPTTTPKEEELTTTTEKEELTTETTTEETVTEESSTNDPLITGESVEKENNFQSSAPIKIPPKGENPMIEFPENEIMAAIASEINKPSETEEFLTNEVETLPNEYSQEIGSQIQGLQEPSFNEDPYQLQPQSKTQNQSRNRRGAGGFRSALRASGPSFHCYSINVVDGDTRKVKKGCVKVPEEQSACDVLQAENANGKSIEKCYICSEDKCNSSPALRFSIFTVFFVLLTLYLR